jgi:hypothetical protein
VPGGAGEEAQRAGEVRAAAAGPVAVLAAKLAINPSFGAICSKVVGVALETRRYLKAGADPLAGDYDRRTPLHIAAAEGDLVALQLMVEATSCKVDPADRCAP